MKNLKLKVGIDMAETVSLNHIIYFFFVSWFYDVYKRISNTRAHMNVFSGETTGVCVWAGDGGG